jgi:hypothetical protein
LENELNTGYARLAYKDQVCYVYFKEDIVTTAEIIENIHQTGLQFSNNQPHAMLVDLSLNVSSTIEGRKYGAKNKYMNKHIAYALIGKSLPVNLLANFFIRINQPKIETKLFVDEKVALDWLKIKIEKYRLQEKLKKTAKDN